MSAGRCLADADQGTDSPAEDMTETDLDPV